MQTIFFIEKVPLRERSGGIGPFRISDFPEWPHTDPANSTIRKEFQMPVRTRFVK